MTDTSPLMIAAVDESPFFEPVVQRAHHMAGCMQSRLVVLHVYPARSANYANEASMGDLTLRSNEDRDLEEEVKIRQRLEPRLEAIGVKPSVLEIVGGTPARTVEEMVNKRGATLLVVGQPKARLGSLATKMVKNAPCDVYIVRVND